MKRFSLFAFVCIAVALGAGCTKEAKKTRFARSGEKYFNAGRWDKAEVEFLNVVRLDPANAVVLTRLGTMYLDQGRYERAFGFLKEAAQLAPNTPPVQFQLAQLYFSAGDFANARKGLSNVIAQDAGHPEAITLLAEMASSPAERKQVVEQIQALTKASGDKAQFHVALGVLATRENNLKTAEAEFRQAASMDPKLPTPLLSLGMLAWQNGDLTAAERELTAAAGLSPIRSLRRMKLVEFYRKNGKAAEARKTLDQLVGEAPDYVLAWKQIAEMQLAAKELDKCIATASRILAIEPLDADAGVVVGRVRLAQGKTAEAVRDLEAARARHPQRADLYYHVALAYLVNNDMNKAVASLQRCVTLNTNLYEATMLLAELRTRQGDPAGSILLLTDLLKKRPNDEQAQYLLAGAYNARGTPNDAVAVYQQLLKANPKNARAALLTGIVLRRENKLVEARRSFEKVLELMPNALDGLFQLVEMDVAEKSFDAALQRVQVAIEAKPKVPELRVLQGKIHLEQGDYVQAEISLRKCLELAPDSPEAYQGLAQILIKANKMESAMNEVSKALAKNPNDVSSLMTMGILHESKGEYAKARDVYEKLLTVQPQHLVALNNLAYIYSVRTKDLDKALSLAQKARQLMANTGSGSAAAADTLGWVTYLRGDYAGALILLQESATTMTDEPEVQYHLGMTYYMMGQEPQARAALQRAVAGKEYVGKEEAKAKLALLSAPSGKTPDEMIASLEKSVAENPKDVPLLLRLSALYEQRSMATKAQALAESVLEINPKAVRAMLVLARIYGAKPEGAQKAFEYAKSARAEAPNDAEVAHAAGRAAFQMGQHDWAYSILQETSRASADPEYQYDFAMAAYSVGKVADAEGSMQLALRQNPTFSRAEQARRFVDMVTLVRTPAQIPPATARVQQALAADANYVPGLMASAAAWELRSGYAEAKKTYERVLTLYPRFSPATRALAILYADRLDEPEKGYELATKARREYPEDTELAKALGKLAYRRNEYQYAAQLLKEMRNSTKADAETYFYLGMSQHRLKQKAESTASLKQALAMNLDAKLSEEARKVLATP